MKKIICSLLIITLVVIFMSSCEKYERTGENSYILKTWNTQSVRGIENFSRSADTLDLCAKLLQRGFLEK